jgi:phenylpropionate dioxygenase-like ring-hydroxylating dioxygenase large terminal subunit
MLQAKVIHSVIYGTSVAIDDLVGQSNTLSRSQSTSKQLDTILVTPYDPKHQTGSIPLFVRGDVVAIKASFLSQRYGAYHHREIPNEDVELTHVGPGTPGGEYLRRFWHPVAPPLELKDLPLRLRILGEDLVLFRNKIGQVGLLELHCSHRGTSLEYGMVEERGIRCCYHGWLFGVDGRILDTPGEPLDSTYRQRLCHGAYPVHEYADMVFAYMGPPDKKPAFPIYDTYEIPGYHLQFGWNNYLPCNWLQISDNIMDPAHTAFLHTISSTPQFLNKDGQSATEFGDVGELDFMETPIGVIYICTRRVGNDIWVRSGEQILSIIYQFPGRPIFPVQYPNGKQEVCYIPRTTQWTVPIDDTNTLTITARRVRNGENDYSSINPALGMTKGQTADRPYEERQRSPLDYEAEVGQRPIAVHALEHLGSTDRGIIMYRNMIREGIQAVQDGEDPKGVWREHNGPISTYSTDTMLRIPPAPTPQKDKELLRETGRMVAERYLQQPPLKIAYSE